MGNCFCCSSEEEFVRAAIKLPNGVDSIQYDNSSGKFVPIKNINDWISELYAGAKWTNWLVYNDDTSELDIKGTTKGHCKGILAWNNEHISWLIHSVPNFPRIFKGDTISVIEPGEHIYGQSFCYTQYTYTKSRLDNILQQLVLMEPHIYNKQMEDELPKSTKSTEIKELYFSDNICHIAKSPVHFVDIYSEYLCKKDKSIWTVETWKRGSKIKKCSTNMLDVETLTYEQTIFKDSQDHSKWAACEEYCFIGDLNRMESQSKRGGGGILIRDKKMARAFQGLVDEVVIKFVKPE
jgi:deoxyribonuclease-2